MKTLITSFIFIISLLNPFGGFSQVTNFDKKKVTKSAHSSSKHKKKFTNLHIPKTKMSDLNKVLRDHYGLNEDHEFIEFRNKQDDLGHTHKYFKQWYHGYLVHNGISVVHINDEGIYAINGNVIGFDSSLGQKSPSIEVVKSLEAQNINLESKTPKIYAIDDEPVLAYGAFTRNEMGERKILYSATSGDVINSEVISEHCTSVSVPVTWESSNVDINIQDIGGGNYSLVDDCSTNSWKLTTESLPNLTHIAGLNGWGTQSNRATTTAHWAMSQALDYYKNSIPQRDSWNGMGADVNVEVSELFFYGAAFFPSQTGQTGVAQIACSTDGLENGPWENALDDYTTLDVMGHELTHAVLYSEELYSGEHEAEALAESFCDIFGNAVQWYVQQPVTRGWQVGEERIVDEESFPVRDMANPNNPNVRDPGPDTYLGDLWTGTSDHKDAGVQNYWFYLLTEGDSGENDFCEPYDVTGIGLTKALKIVYKSMTTYLSGFPDYAAAREASILAAQFLYPDVGGEYSLETATVAEAWDAVGVYGVFEINDDGPITINKTYNADLYVNANVQFVNSTLKFTPGHGIIIEPGKTVSFTDCTLTRDDSACAEADKTWTGIYLRDYMQFGDGDNTLTISNTDIEYAEIGIQARKYRDAVTIVVEDESMFLNNRSGISTICDATVTIENSTFSAYDVPTGLTSTSQIGMWRGVLDITDTDLTGDMYYGISINQVELTMEGDINANAQPEVSDWTQAGITCHYWDANNIFINGYTFKNSIANLNFESLSNVDVHNSNFEIKGNSVGIKLSGVGFVDINNNNFTNFGSSASTGVGIMFEKVVEKGAINNSIDNNKFEHLNDGVVTMGQQGSPSGGLEFLCNTFTTDIVANNFKTEEINPTQGATDESAGNSFFHNAAPGDDSDFNTTGSLPITYFQRSIGSEALVDYSFLVNPVTIFNQPECPDIMNFSPPFDPTEPTSSVPLQPHKTSDDDVIFPGTTDGGDTDVLVSVIENYSDTNTPFVLATLNNASPWVSAEAIYALLENSDYYTENEIVNVLSQNSTLLLNSYVAYLVNEAHCFSPSNTALLNAAYQTGDLKKNLIYKFIEFQDEYDDYVMDLIRYENAQTNPDIQRIKSALSVDQSLHGKYRLISFLLNNDLDKDVQSEFKSIDFNDIYNPRDLAELVDFNRVVEIQTDYSDLSQLPAQEISDLNTIATNNSGVGSIKAALILNNNFGYNLPITQATNTYTCPSFYSGPFIKPEKEDDSVLNVGFYPNPSYGEISVVFDEDRLNESQATVRLIDASGRLVFEKKNVTNGERIDLNLSNGVYSIHCSAGNRSFSDKIIILK